MEVTLASWTSSSSPELKTCEVKKVLTSQLKQESRALFEGGLTAFLLYITILQLVEWNSSVLEQYALLRTNPKLNLTHPFVLTFLESYLSGTS